MWLKHVDKEDLGIIGRKGVQLGELAQAGIPIPEGFVVPSSAYFQFVRENKLEHKIKALLSTAHFDYADSLMQISAHIKHLILQTPLSETLKKDIAAHYKKIAKDHHNPLLFLHASQVAPASLPGQHEQHFYIHGEENLLQKIHETWASLFEPHALVSRHHHHQDHFKVGMALVVQRMIQTDVSGVMLTTDHHDKTKITIRTKLGGKPSNHYTVDKSSLTITNSYLKTYPSPLKENEVIALAQLGKKIESHLYFPQHADWALEQNKLYILHTRPL